MEGKMSSNQSDTEVLKPGDIITLPKMTFKINRLNAMAMTRGCKKGKDDIIHQSIYCSTRPRRFPRLITLNKKLIEDNKKLQEEQINPNIDLESCERFARDYKYNYIAAIDSEHFINNEEKLWGKICTNGLFDIWLPKAPLKVFQKSKSKKSQFRILLLRIYEIEKGFTTNDIKKRNPWTDEIIPADENGLEVKIIKPVINDDKFAKIKGLLEESIKDYRSSPSSENEPQRHTDLLETFRQIILTGPPGTSKTWTAKEVAAKLICGSEKDAHNKDSDFNKNGQFTINRNEDKKYPYKGQWSIAQFHPSYNYEDFVRGILVRTDGNENIVYETVNRILGHMALAACREWDENKEKAKKFVLIIDEINRANLAAVFGELIYALEYRDEYVETPYAVNGETGLRIPPNLHIIGTMNTADRSIGHIDYAVRRRFAFVPCLPDKKVIEDYYGGNKIWNKAITLFEKVENLFSEEYLSPDFHKDDVQVGHTYFLVDKSKEPKDMAKELAQKFIYQVYPLLREYYKEGIFKESGAIPIEINGNIDIDMTKPFDYKGLSDRHMELIKWCEE